MEPAAPDCDPRQSDATQTGRYRLIAGMDSPYSYKLRALMTYRHVPFDWVLRDRVVFEELEPLGRYTLPVLQFPDDGRYEFDSTPLAYELEMRHAGHRSVVPTDPVHALLAHLLEDMADEWLSRVLFHYRWSYGDVGYASRRIARSLLGPCDATREARAAEKIAQRQCGLMRFMKTDETNAEVLTGTYGRVLNLLERHFTHSFFLFGSRPSLAEFGIFGQLRTLSLDPTPGTRMRNDAERVYQWIQRMEDASGIYGEWLRSDDLPKGTRELLELCAQTYLPAAAANARAVERGDAQSEAQIFDCVYTQQAYRYGADCLRELRDERAALDGAARERADALLAQTGCLQFL